MKVLAVVLLCAFAAVQGRSAAVKSSRSLAALGDNPWLVHLRIAVSTSGFLETCAGSLIDNRWVLTAASCVSNSRFIWIRYGVVNVINPSLVTENSIVTLHPEYNAATGDNNVAVISVNRYVETTESITPIPLVGGSIPESTNFCGFGHDGNDGPGEVLSCYKVSLSLDNVVVGPPSFDSTPELITATSEDGAASKFDVGAPLVNNGVQVGLLIAGASESNQGTFVSTSGYVSWLEGVTGVSFDPVVELPTPGLVQPEPVKVVGPVEAIN